MKFVAIAYMAFLTFVIVAGIHNYEAKLKEHKASIEDYKRALNLAKHYSNADHYTQLQIQNKSLIEQVRDLDQTNQLLIKLNKDLSQKMAGDFQYESSVYKSSAWE